MRRYSFVRQLGPAFTADDDQEDEGEEEGEKESEEEDEEEEEEEPVWTA